MDVFNLLIEANFLSSGQTYSAVNVSQGNQPLDAKKTISENGVRNNDNILTLITTIADESNSIYYKFLYNYSEVQNEVKCIIEKKWWNAEELATVLQIHFSEADSLLKVLGYNFHEKLGIYSHTEETDKIFKDKQHSLQGG